MNTVSWVLCVPPYGWWGWAALLDKGGAKAAHKVVSDLILPPASSLLFPGRAALSIIAPGHAYLPFTVRNSGWRLLGTRITAPPCLPFPCCRSSNPVRQWTPAECIWRGTNLSPGSHCWFFCNLRKSPLAIA